MCEPGNACSLDAGLAFFLRRDPSIFPPQIYLKPEWAVLHMSHAFGPIKEIWRDISPPLCQRSSSMKHFVLKIGQVSHMIYILIHPDVSPEMLSSRRRAHSFFLGLLPAHLQSDPARPNKAGRATVAPPAVRG